MHDNNKRASKKEKIIFKLNKRNKLNDRGFRKPLSASPRLKAGVFKQYLIEEHFLGEKKAQSLCHKLAKRRPILRYETVGLKNRFFLEEPLGSI